MGRHFVIFFVLLSIGCSNQNKQGANPNFISHISQQMDYAVQLADQAKDSVLLSPRTIENGKLKLVRVRDWTSGFFAGNLWMVYDLTGDEKWKEKALEYTLPLEQEQWDGGTHDLGFKMFNSFGKAYQFTGNEIIKKLSFSRQKLWQQGSIQKLAASVRGITMQTNGTFL